MTAMSMFITETILTLKPMVIETYKWFLEDDTEEVMQMRKVNTHAEYEGLIARLKKESE